MSSEEQPNAPSKMGKYKHKFAKDLDNLVEGQEYTRFEISQHKLCAFLQDGEFCCTKRKTQRGKLCEEHAAVLAASAKNKAASRKASHATAKPQTNKRYKHARWDELLGANVAQNQFLTPDELFALKYCTFIDQGRFCCAQKLDAKSGGGRLCADHQQRVRREQDLRAEQRKKEQAKREEQRIERQKKREQAQLKQLANSLQLAQGVPDTAEIRMRMARRIFAMTK